MDIPNRFEEVAAEHYGLSSPYAEKLDELRKLILAQAADEFLSAERINPNAIEITQEMLDYSSDFDVIGMHNRASIRAGHGPSVRGLNHVAIMHDVNWNTNEDE